MYNILKLCHIPPCKVSLPKMLHFRVFRRVFVRDVIISSCRMKHWQNIVTLKE